MAGNDVKMLTRRIQKSFIISRGQISINHALVEAVTLFDRGIEIKFGVAYEGGAEHCRKTIESGENNSRRAREQ